LRLPVSNKNIKFIVKNIKRIINTLIVIIILIVSLNIYNIQKKRVLTYKKNLEYEKNKNELLKELIGLENKLIDCRKALGKFDTSDMLSTVSSLAEQANLKIIAVKPQPDEETPLYTKSKIKLVLEAENYHTIGNFISKLEASPDLYKIESLTIIPAKKSGVQLISPDKKIEEEPVLNAEIVIIRFIFKG